MARVVDFRLSKYDTAATTTVARLPAGVESGQLIVAVYGFKASAGSHSTPSGYSVGATIAGSNNVLSAFYKIAGASETNPSSNHASDAERFAAVFIVEDFDAANPVDVSASGLTSATVTSGKLIAAPANLSVGNVLCLHVGSCAQWRHLLLDAGIMQLFSEYIIDGSYSAAAAWTFEESSGLSTAFGWSQSRASDSNARALCIPIRSAATPVIPARHNPGTTLSRPITPLGSFNGTGPNSSSPRDPTGVGELTEINGIGTNKSTESGLPGYGVNPFNYEPYIATGNGVTANEFYLTHFELDAGATVDASGKKVCVHPVNMGSPFRMGTVAESGMIVGVSTLDNGTDTTTFAYDIVTGGGIDADSPAVKAVVFDEAATLLQETNTPDWSAINGVVFGTLNVAGSDIRVGASDAQVLETIEIIGGDDDASNEKWADWETAYDAARSANLRTVVKQGNAFITFHDINVGDGSSFLQFSTNSKILQAPAPGDFQFQAASVAVTVNLASANVFEWKDPVEGGGTMDVSILGTAGDNVSFSGGLLNNPKSLSLGDIGTGKYSGFTVSNTTAEVIGDGSMRGITFQVSTAPQTRQISGASAEAIQALLEEYANATFSGCAVAIEVEYTGAAADIALTGPSNLTFEDCTVELRYRSTNASELTFTPGSGATTPSATAIAGAATGVVIDSASPVTLQTSGTIADGTVYQISNVTQGIANLYTGAVSGGAISISATKGAGLDIEDGDTLRIRMGYQSTTTYKEPLQAVAVVSGSTVTFIIDQQDWAVPNALGINGSSLTASFEADTGDGEYDIKTGANFSGNNLQAFIAYTMGTLSGIQNFWGAAILRTGEIEFDYSVMTTKLDNTSATNIRESTRMYIHASDGTYPVKNEGATSGGGGIDINWTEPVYTTPANGSGVTEQDKVDIVDQVFARILGDESFSALVQGLRADVDGLEVAAAAILDDTGNALPTQIDGISGGLDAAGVRAAVGLASANLDTQLTDISASVAVVDDVADDNNRLLKNKQYTDPDDGKLKVYADNDTDVLYEAPLYDDDGVTAWDGTNAIQRRDKLQAPS